MSQQQRHIIQKQLFDIRVSGKEGNFELQQQISHLYWTNIVPAVEQLLNKIVPVNEVISIDRLELDIHISDLNNLEEELTKAILDALRDRLEYLLFDATFPDQSIERTPLKMGQLTQWLHYLETGVAAWSSVNLEESKQQENILEVLATEQKAIQQVRNVLKQTPHALERIVLQYEEAFLYRLVEVFNAKPQKDLVEIRRVLEKILRQIVELAKTNLKYQSIKSAFYQKTSKFRYFFWKIILQNSILQEEKKSSIALAQLFIKEQYEKLFEQKEVIALLKTIVGQLTTSEKATFQQIIEASRLKNRLEEKSSQKNTSTEVDQIADSINEKTEEVSQLVQPKSDLDHKNRKVTSDTTTEEEIVSKNERKITSKEALDNTISQKSKSNPTTETEQQSKIKEDHQPEDTTITKLEESLSIHKQNSEEEKINTLSTTEISDKKISKENDLNKNNSLKNSTLKNKPDPNLESSTYYQEQATGTSYYVQNAGIILIHPFLSHYFKGLELLNGKQFMDKEAQELAVYLLQYLATGEEQSPESDLLLMKFLCHLPLNYPVNRFIEIPKEAKKEAGNLLQAALNHWGALPNTSPNGLREGFLKRDGKLEKRGNTWHLIVEQKTLDLLLTKLPWNISLVKFPWEKDLLHVEWNR